MSYSLRVMREALRVVVFVVGAFCAGATFGSAVLTVVLPRGIPARLTRIVFLSTRALFSIRIGRKASYERIDRVLAIYAPMSLLVLLQVWLAIVLVGYACMFWALEPGSVTESITISGSSLLTLGFQRGEGLPSTLLSFTEAAIGLALLALLITYLPSLYAAFSRREQGVASLEIRAGSPPSGAAMIERMSRINDLPGLGDVWRRWENWFVDLEETHTSFPALTFFRSPQPEQSWVTAAGAVLDGASLAGSTLAGPRDPDTDLVLRAGYVALRRIASFFGIPFDRNPRPDDPISITRAEYDEVYDRFVGIGIALKTDRDQAWRDFAGWRVNYDAVLLELASLTSAPTAPWSSDRAPPFRRPRIFRR